MEEVIKYTMEMRWNDVDLRIIEEEWNVTRNGG